MPALSGNKRKLPGEFSGSVKTYPKRKRMDPKSNQETNEDVCCVCFGLYKDDVNNTNRFSAAAWIVAYGAMSVAWKRQMESTFVQSAKVYLCNHFRILCLIQL